MILKLPRCISKGFLGSLLALSLSGVGAAQAADGPSILFIGNSFSGRHDLPKIVKELADEGHPDRPIRIKSVGYGGRDLFRHYELFRSQDLLNVASLTDADLEKSVEEMLEMAKPGPEPAVYTEYWEKINAAALIPYEKYEAKANGITRKRRSENPGGKRWREDQILMRDGAVKMHRFWIRQRAELPTPWDYVSLQSWYDISPDPETGYQKYAGKFAEIAKRQNIKPVLYITAPYCQNAEPVSEPVEPARVLGEMHLMADLAKKLDAIVVPVPLAIYRLQKAGTNLTFRYINDGHPNQVCAYLTACLFYAAIYDKSPEGLKFSEVVETKIVDPAKPDLDPDGKPLKRVFSDEERTLLQRAAWETVQAFRKGEF